MENEISCRETSSIIKYVESVGCSVAPLFDALPFTKDYFTNPLNWTTVELRDTLASRAAALTGDAKIMLKIGAATPDLRATAGFEHFVRLFGSPKIAYKNFPRFAPYFGHYSNFQIDMISDNTVLIHMTQNSAVLPSIHSCYFTQGVLSAIPRLWHFPAAEVRELDCACRPAADLSLKNSNPITKSCLYEVKWQQPRSFYLNLKNLFFGRNVITAGTIDALDYQLPYTRQKK